jgi:nitroimidazol reductase NimA-like FMN-containing flavoprotein (pyridoxamine 5'-phosphate oxidase superfamily)
MNYRSVVILGTASPVTDRDRKLVAMRALVDHLIPDRWPDLRPVTDKELRATLVLELPLRKPRRRSAPVARSTTRRTTR